jgi:hypothetical protein
MNKKIIKIYMNIKNKKHIIITALVVIIVGVASFYCGSKFSQSSNNFKQGNMRQGTGIAMNPNSKQNGQGGLISGDIASKDGSTLTVNLKSGGSKIILFSDKTKIYKSVDGSLDDLSVGSNINITGTQNQDGSVSAQSIQVKQNITSNPETTPAPNK